MLTPEIDIDLTKELEITTTWGVKRNNSGESFMEKRAVILYHEDGNCLEEMVVGWEYLGMGEEK